MLPKSLNSAALHRLELLQLRSKRAFLGLTQGSHISLKRGHGIEFSDYRKYEPGDNPRDIDWNLYARSDRMYVKTFHEEQNLALYLVVDGSRSMHLPEGTNKWDFASSIALALAFIALSQRDQVSADILGGGALLRVNSSHGFHHLAKLFSESSEAEPDIPRLFRAFLSRIRAPGILIFISDFLLPLETIEAVATQTRSKNVDATFIQTLSAFDREPYRFSYTDVIDGETGVRASLPKQLPREAYAQALQSHIQSVEEIVNGSRIRFIAADTSEDPVTFVGTKLRDLGIIS